MKTKNNCRIFIDLRQLCSFCLYFVVRKLVSSGPKERTLRKARSILADSSYHLHGYFVLFPSGRR